MGKKGGRRSRRQWLGRVPESKNIVKEGKWKILALGSSRWFYEGRGWFESGVIVVRVVVWLEAVK